MVDRPSHLAARSVRIVLACCVACWWVSMAASLVLLLAFMALWKRTNGVHEGREVR